MLALLTLAASLQVQSAPILIDEAAVRRMHERYVALGLPLPAPGAQIVELPWGGAASLLGAGSTVGTQKLLIGAEVREVRLPNLESLEPPDSAFNTRRVYLDQRLAVAMQLVHLGRVQEAVDLTRAIENIGEQHNYRHFDVREDARSPEMVVSYFAYIHWINDFIDPRADRIKALEGMERLFAVDKTQQIQNLRGVVDQMRETITLRSDAGTYDSLIDGLTTVVAMRQEGCFGRSAFTYFDGHLRKAQEPIKRINEVGAAMIPALIRHLDDGRLTRAIDDFDLRPRVLTVGEFCNALLLTLSRSIQGRWWEEVEELTESKAIELLTTKEQNIFVMDLMLEMLSQTNPEAVQSIAQDWMRTRPREAERFFYYFPNAKALEIIEPHMYSPNVEARWVALDILKRCKDARVDRVTRALLIDMPTLAEDHREQLRQRLNGRAFNAFQMQGDDEYKVQARWDPIVDLSGMISVHANKEMVDELMRQLQSVDGPIRMAAISRFARVYDSENPAERSLKEPRAKARLQFLAHFLSDKELVIEESPELGDFRPWGDFEPYEVRQAAAYKIWLDLGSTGLAAPHKSWSEEVWANYYVKLVEELQRHGISVDRSAVEISAVPSR